MRTRIHAVYATLCADNFKLALALVEGFGIPPHLIAAPIAFNWRTIGQQQV